MRLICWFGGIYACSICVGTGPLQDGINVFLCVHAADECVETLQDCSFVSLMFMRYSQRRVLEALFARYGANS